MTLFLLAFTIVWDLYILLELEYKYGTPEQFTPAIEDVLNYLQNVYWYLPVVTILPWSLQFNTDSIFQGK